MWWRKYRCPCADFSKARSATVRAEQESSRTVAQAPPTRKWRRHPWPRAPWPDAAARRQGLGRPRHLRRLLQIHLHQSRDARLAHGDAAKLVRAFHGRLVVGDDDELHFFGHVAH